MLASSQEVRSTLLSALQDQCLLQAEAFTFYQGASSSIEGPKVLILTCRSVKQLLGSDSIGVSDS